MTEIIFKGVKIIAQSYLVEAGNWRAHALLLREEIHGVPVSLVASPYLFESEADANALAISRCRVLIARGTWGRGLYPTKNVDQASSNV